MQYVSTNLRFPKKEYESLKNIAFIQKKSIAQIVRDAVREYKSKVLNKRTDRQKLYDLIVKSRVDIDIPTHELVKIGRKFE